MQLTLYLDSGTERLAKTAAEAEGLSLSRWVANKIHEATLAQWPKTVVDAAGAFPDWPLVESQPAAADVPRESLD